MRETYTKQEVQRIKRNFDELDNLTKLEFDNFLIEKERLSTINVFRTDPKEKVFSLESIDDLSVYMVNLICSLGSSFEEDIGDWTYVEDTEHPTWKTPFLDLEVSINPKYNYTGWRVSLPLKVDSDIYQRSPDSFEVGCINMLVYLNNVNAYRVDYVTKLKEIAKEEFEKLPGIGSSISNKLVEKNSVYSFEELVNTQYRIKNTKDKKEAVREAEKKAKTDQEVKNHPKLKEIQQYVLVDNI